MPLKWDHFTSVSEVCWKIADSGTQSEIKWLLPEKQICSSSFWCFQTQLLIPHYWHTLSNYIHWSNTQKSGSNFNEVMGVCACSMLMSIPQDDKHESLYFASGFFFAFTLSARTNTNPATHTHRSRGFSNKKLLDQRQAEHKGAAGQAKEAWSPSSSSIPAGTDRICH